jgi:hypothetical protein
MKGPAINNTPVQRAGRIAAGAAGVMMLISNGGAGGERR